MTSNAFVQVAMYFVAVVGLGLPLGLYMARVFTGQATIAQTLLGPVEKLIYRGAGIQPDEEMPWTRYAGAVLVYSMISVFVVYALQRLQAGLPFNPVGLGAVAPELSWSTATSFATNTNWQAYGGETTMSYLTQTLGLTVQNFVSAAAGIAVLIALIRGFTGRSVASIGSFWVDLTRATLYVLLPLSLVLSLALVQQGVVQTWGPALEAQLLEPSKVTVDGVEKVVATQAIAVGPAASQVAIKQLGTNGGGFFNANSAHPLENPTPLSNFLEMLAILLIPTALCFTFGALVKDQRQGWAVLSAMFVVILPLLALCVFAEQGGNPLLTPLGADQAVSALQAGGNMEGKEVRFGIVNSALWATVTTAASNGSVNAMHDSFTPLGGLVPMWLMQLGEIIFGGVGSGLYGMLMFAIVAVFIAGLMVGRTPEYLGKKIEAYEMKMAAIVILVPAAAVLIGTAIACATPAGTATLNNPGAHGFSEILYAYSSAGNNNGSAFAGLGAAGVFYCVSQGYCMLFARFWVMIPVLAIAGNLAAKRQVPPGVGTLSTHTPLFVAFLVGTIMLVGALTFLPALALGPIVEHLQLFAAR